MTFLEKLKGWSLLLAVLTLFITSCDPDEPTLVPTDDFSNGVIILNEGTFSEPSSLSFFFKDSLLVRNQVFSTNNSGELLGTLAQSVYEWNDNLYIMVSNSNKIEVLDVETMEKKATITGIDLPRYFTPISNDEAAVSYWSDNGLDGGVAFINLNDFSVTSTITTGNGPENMLIKDNNLYVANSGGFGMDSTISVIALADKTISKTITVSEGPAFIREVGGDLYVLSKGVYDPTIMALTDGGFGRISNDVLVADQTLTNNPDKFILGKTNGASTDFFFLRSDGVYSGTISSSLGGLPVYSQIIAGSFYGLGYDAEEDLLYVGDAGDFASPGKIIRYQTDGTKVDEYTVGVAPGSFLAIGR